MTLFLRSCILSALAIWTNTANSSLIGNNVDCSISGLFGESDLGYITCDQPSAAVVTPGTEFFVEWFGAPYWSVNFENGTLVIENTPAAPWFTFGHTDPATAVIELVILNWPSSGTIQDISVSSSFIENYDTSFVTYTDSSLSIPLTAGLIPNAPQGVLWSLGGQLRIDLDIGSRVPAPATLALLSIGLAGLGWTRRNKA